MESQHDIPFPREYEADLFSRIRELAAMEVAGNVQLLYEFTLPKIRAERIAERTDEPGLSLTQIAAFVKHIKSAEVLSISVDKFVPSLERHGGWPAALVNSTVRYNEQDTASKFRTIWVLVDKIWFTTALGKFWSTPCVPL